MRTLHGRLLLRPSPRANDLIAGVIGRAQRKYDMRIHGLVFLGTHAHLLLSPESPQQLAAFMDYVAGNVAREIGRLHHWRERFWSRRYRAILSRTKKRHRSHGSATCSAMASKRGWWSDRITGPAFIAPARCAGDPSYAAPGSTEPPSTRLGGGARADLRLTSARASRSCSHRSLAGRSSRLRSIASGS
jgi:REP element-mobilizing transposase RayT